MVCGAGGTLVAVSSHRKVLSLFIVGGNLTYHSTFQCIITNTAHFSFLVCNSFVLLFGETYCKFCPMFLCFYKVNKLPVNFFFAYFPNHIELTGRLQSKIIQHN